MADERTYGCQHHSATADYGMIQSDEERIETVRIIFHPGVDDTGTPGQHEYIYLDPDSLPQVIGQLQGLADQLAVLRGQEAAEL